MAVVVYSFAYRDWTIQGVERGNRLCLFCNVVEDEEHAVYTCKAYKSIREGREELLTENPSIREPFNPKDKETAYKVGCLLKDIEDRRKTILERQ